MNHTEKPTAAEDVEAWDGRVERARMGDGQGDRICEGVGAESDQERVSLGGDNQDAVEESDCKAAHEAS